MTGSGDADFPALRRVFEAYLHEDFVAEYGSAAGALKAFHADASRSERRHFASDARRFLDRTERLGLDELRALMARMGSRWRPPSRNAVVALLAPDDAS